MATRHDLQAWIVDALQSAGGSGSPVSVAKTIWAAHEGDPRASGDLFFTWQYDVRWEAQKLRNAGKLAPVGRGVIIANGVADAHSRYSKFTSPWMASSEFFRYSPSTRTRFPMTSKRPGRCAKSG